MNPTVLGLKAQGFLIRFLHYRFLLLLRTMQASILADVASGFWSFGLRALGA